MKKTMLSLLACTVLLAGCAKNQDDKVASLEKELETTQAELDMQKQRNDTLGDLDAKRDGEMRELQDEIGNLRVKLETAKKQQGDSKRLQDKIDSLEASIAELEAAAAQPKETPAEPPEVTEKTPDEPTPPDPAVKQRLSDLLPRVKTGADREATKEAVKLISSADKQTRDDFIKEMENWVKDDPENIHAHLTLATALTSRFQDLADNPMKQGALASQIKDEIDNALEVDPDYYDAVRFKAILEVNYPTFTPEFKEADKALDKALELQDKLTWEDRFADMYTAYGEWYLKQNKLDEAAAKVQAGLDHAPRNQGLLDEQAKIADARNEGSGD